MKRNLLVVVAFVLALATSAALAANIGQWTGSLRSWNHPDMSVLRTLLVAQGHTVEADGPLNAAGLAGDGYFVIAEPTVAVSVPEAAELLAFVEGGGVLILVGDTSTNLGLLNDVILTPLGSALAFQSAGAVNAPLASGDRAVDGPPHALAGNLLSVSTGWAVGGGTEIAGTYARVQTIGAGKVYVFGDRLDHNALVIDGASVNSRLFANLFTASLPSPLPAEIPLLSPAMLAVLSAALALLGLRSRHR